MPQYPNATPEKNNSDDAKPNPLIDFRSLSLSAGFIKGANRFEIGYGKKREGIFCVGGVCKLVPSSSGFNLSISSNF